MDHKHGNKEGVDSPSLSSSSSAFIRHPMGVELDENNNYNSNINNNSPQTCTTYREISSPQMISSPQIHNYNNLNNYSMSNTISSPQMNNNNNNNSPKIFSPSLMKKQKSSPALPSSPKINNAMFKENSSPALIKRERSNSIFARERSNSIFKDKSSSVLSKFGLQRRLELDVFLQNRGFCSEELDSIVNQFHDIREQLEGGEWVTRGEFRNFFGVREQSFSDHLFDVFKQRHKMHNFKDLDFCPSPQMSREVPVGSDGIEMDAINVREFLCGMLLLQSSDIDKKLRMVYDLYTVNGSSITKDSLKAMLLVSAKENKIKLANEQFDTLVDHIFNKMDESGSGAITFDGFKKAFQDIPLELEQRSQLTPINEFLSMNTSSPSSPIKPFSWTISVDDDPLKEIEEREREKEERERREGVGSRNPEFVDQVYEDDDPKRSRRKSQKFEAKTNYFPQQESMPKSKSTTNRKIRTRLHASGAKYVFLTLFFLLNIGFFTWHFLVYGLNESVTGNLGWGVPFARAFAQVLKIDTVLLLIPVSRNVMTYIRASPLHSFIPLDKNLSFHKFLASAVLFASVGHWGAHLYNFHKIATADLANLQTLNPSYFTSVPSYVKLNFGTIPGITGYVMIVCLLVMFLMASKRVRRFNFEKFYFVHHLFVIFYIALVLHGVSHILGPYEYWKWFVGPAAIYVIERGVRVYKLRRNVRVLESKILPDRAIMLKMAVPQRRFTYKAGQYIFLNCPTISKFEWHPFTLTSAPHEDFISVHIRAAGNWTNKMYDLCASDLKGNTDFLVSVDGPYGSASEHVFGYKHAIMIGAGIGVTPFASVLKRLLYRLQTEQGMKKIEKVHFFWTCREQGAFQWFADILSQLEAHKDTKGVLEINTFLTGALAQHDIRSLLLWYGLQQEFAEKSVDLVTGLSSRTYWGRPNYEKIIEYLFQQYPKERVGVFFCGPRPMAHELKNFCKKFAPRNGSTFHFHQEVF